MTNIGLLVLRLSVGIGMAIHGYDKLTNYDSMLTQFPDLLGIGIPLTVGLVIFAEFFCALLVVGGLLTRLATIPVIITMLVAFFVAHGADPFSKKELAFLYLNSYLALFFCGPGDFSIQKMFKISAGRFSWLLS